MLCNYNTVITIYFQYTAIKCLPLPPINNGFVTYAPDTTPNYDLGTVATYTCNNGSSMTGSETRTCVDDDGMGVFMGNAPSCVCKLWNEFQLD